MAQFFQGESLASGSSTERRAEVIFKLLGKRKCVTTRKNQGSGPSQSQVGMGGESLKNFNVDDVVPGAALLPSEHLMIVKVILTSQNVPKVRLRRDAIKKIKDKLQKLTEQSNENPPPLVVVQPVVIQNSLRVDCIGVDVRDFFAPLHGLFINDFKIKVIVKQILTEQTRILCLTQYSSGLKVLSFIYQLQKLYLPLNTKDWYVIESLIQDDTVKITFLIDQQSANFIEDCGFSLTWTAQSSDEQTSDSSNE